MAERIANVAEALWLLACIGAALAAGKILGDPQTWSVQGVTLLVLTFALMSQYPRAGRLGVRIYSATRRRTANRDDDPVSCPGCGFTVGGVTSGCVDCCRRSPGQYVEMASEMAAELDQLRAVWESRRIQYAAMILLDGQPVISPVWSGDRREAAKRIAMHSWAASRVPRRGETKLLRRYMIITKPEEVSDGDATP